MSLPEKIAQSIATQATELGAESIAVAFSGGLDSRVLLEMVASISTLPIQAIHVHHGLSEHADQWVEHTRATCQSLGVSLIVARVQIDASKAGIEAGAREARYSAFEQHLARKTLLVTGQHRDDQAETLLLRLFRGAGPEGLAAMPVLREMTFGWLYRPLLEVPRIELEAFAKQRGLSWVEDDSNQDSRFDRNFLRNNILPSLEARWSGVSERIANSARLCAQQNQLVAVTKRDLLATLDLRQEAFGSSIDLPKLIAMSHPEQAMVLRQWLQPQVPERKHLREIDQQLIAGRQDAKACIKLGEIELRRFNERLYRLQWPSIGLDTTEACQWITKPGRYALPFGELQVVCDEQGMFCLPQPLEQQAVFLGFRAGGERVQPSDRHRSTSLKKLFQERGLDHAKSSQGLEPWLRNYAPLLFDSPERNTILAAPGQWQSVGYCPKTASNRPMFRYRLDWNVM